MGIQRFTQDLSPYTETAILGECHSSSDDAVNITDLIIDGPSLAYHVYNKVLVACLLNSGRSNLHVPTYKEIGEAATRLLSDLSRNAVQIRAIFFDGFLPAAKRETRLARLESTRKQLDDFRRLHPQPPWSTSTKHQVDFEGALWSHATVPTRRSIPPPPAFLVPAVIEAVQTSTWAGVLQVVPEEADEACARLAQSSNAAILSNDSDMCVYDLGDHSCVLQLHTLEKHSNDVDSDHTVVRGLCIRPKPVAMRLRIASLPRLAFARSLDNSATFSVVADAARTELIGSDLAEFEGFAGQFAVSDMKISGSTLAGLDPRVAEYVVGSCFSQDILPSVYLPMLYEDPQRDAAWSCGQEFRQLAYSIYIANHGLPVTSVGEYFRKGERITSSQIPILPVSDLGPAISATRELLAGRAAIAGPSDTAMSWYMMALRLVISERLDQGRTIHRADIYALLELSENHRAIIWTSIHLHACVESLLYSLRMLKQLTNSALKAQPQYKADLEAVRSVAAALEDLPSVSEMFVTIAQIRENHHNLALRYKNLLNPIWILLPTAREVSSKKSKHGREKPSQILGQPAKRRKTTSGSKVTAAAHRNPFDVLLQSP